MYVHCVGVCAEIILSLYNAHVMYYSYENWNVLPCAFSSIIIIVLEIVWAWVCRMEHHRVMAVREIYRISVENKCQRCWWERERENERKEI